MDSQRYLTILLLAVLAACEDNDGPSQPPEGRGETPALAGSGGLFRADPNAHGSADALELAELAWGRLVDLYAVGDAGRVLVASDLVVAPDLDALAGDVEVASDPATGATVLTVLHAPGSEAFERVLARLEAGRVDVELDSRGGLAALVPEEVPRDAALLARFSDLIDPASVEGAVEVLAGAPAAVHGARVLVDRHHGGLADRDGDGHAERWPTRLVVDLAVSAHDAREAALAPTPGGLPAGADASLALRAGGLANLRGRTIGGAAALAVSFRAAGRDALGQGLLADFDPPKLVGVQAGTLQSLAADPSTPNGFTATFTYATPACAQDAGPRDVLETPGGVAVVHQVSAAQGPLVTLDVVLVSGALANGPAKLSSAYDPVADSGREACFVEFVPAPAQLPARGVQPDARVRLRFSEPVDAGTVDAFGAVSLARVASPATPYERIAAEVLPDLAQETYEVAPLAPLDHVQGQSEVVHLAVTDDVRDLAGNPLLHGIALSFSLHPSAPTGATGSYVLELSSLDEDSNGAPELRGQFLIDLVAGEIRPRSVTRFSAVADRTQPVPAVMAPFAPGVQVPLSPLGAKLHNLWRYCDVGFALLDEQTMNVDVEGLAWAPVGGSVIADQYPLFEISLAHSQRLPDEAANPQTLLPKHPNSGLVSTYALNPLDPLVVVHPRQRGYSVNPADAFTATTGTTMMPFPLNRGLPASQHEHYTWRDTALQQVGGPGGVGAELEIVANVTGVGSPGDTYAPGQVKSAGLPLLMEFKCFPDAGALGLNAFDVSFAINSSSRPNFRSFSAGGVNLSGQTVLLDPDLATVATGGFNPSSAPPGAGTPPSDNTFYLGQMDLVVRVSRAHTLWVDTQSASPDFAGVALDFGDQALPAGTEVALAWRGATSASTALSQDAARLDAYGEPFQPGDSVAYFGTPQFASSLAAIDGARLAQARITFVSNAATGEIPRLSGLGFSWEE